MNKSRSKQVLVISPHHDDEVLGCGGSIARRIKDGFTVGVVYITAGFSSVVEAKSKKEAILIREKEAIVASKVLGIKKQIFLREEDRGLKFNTELLKKLISVIRNISPDLVYLPHFSDGDREHRLVSEISQEALWIARTPYFSRRDKRLEKEYSSILFYEVWSPLQKPTYFENITNFKDVKIEAMRAYSSQLVHVNYIDAILGLNRYRGQTSGKGDYAEAFAIKSLASL